MSATTYSDIIADTSIKTAGPEGNSFYYVHWLAKEDIENQTQNHQFSASAVELEFLRSERRLRSGKHFA